MGEEKRRAHNMMLPKGFKFEPMPNQPQQIKVDLTKAEQRSCVCGGKYFTQAVSVHIVSALLSPTGHELPVQIPALICMECKTPLTIKSNETE